MGGSSQTRNTQLTSQSATNPWAPTQGLLGGIINQLQPQVSQVGPNANENAALGQIRTNAAGMTNYAPQTTAFANDLMSGGPDRSGYVTDAYGQASGALSPYLSSNYLDPTLTPGIQNALNVVRDDASNYINSQFAGAGRDLSGMHMQSLGRGIAQAEAPLLLDQYNRNVAAQQGAAGQMYGMGVGTAGALSGLDQQSFANRGLGLDTAINGVPAAQNAQANAMLAAEAQARGLPIQNLAQLEALTIPLAGVGSQTSGSMTGTTETTQKANPWQVGIGAGLGLLGMAGGFPGLGSMMTGAMGGTAGFGVGSAAQNAFGSPWAPWYNR